MLRLTRDKRYSLEGDTPSASSAIGKLIVFTQVHTASKSWVHIHHHPPRANCLAFMEDTNASRVFE